MPQAVVVRAGGLQSQIVSAYAQWSGKAEHASKHAGSVVSIRLSCFTIAAFTQQYGAPRSATQ
eukprot:13106979-Alexandrium_andersonii.AAC.1